MTAEEIMFFDGFPAMLPAYEELRERQKEAYPDIKISVKKTQISFLSPRIYCMASLPWRRVKGWPREYMLVSFGLPYNKEMPRIARSVEAYANRWTHHVVVESREEIDRELLSWIDEAYRFSTSK